MPGLANGHLSSPNPGPSPTFCFYVIFYVQVLFVSIEMYKVELFSETNYRNSWNQQLFYFAFLILDSPKKCKHVLTSVIESAKKWCQVYCFWNVENFPLLHVQTIDGGNKRGWAGFSTFTRILINIWITCPYFKTRVHLGPKFKPILAMLGFWKRLLLAPFPKAVAKNWLWDENLALA